MHLLTRFIVILFTFISLTIKGQSVDVTGAASRAMGGMKTCAGDYYCTLTNPAGLVAVTTPGVAFSFSRPYQLTELSSRAAMAVYPSKLGHFSFLYTQSGYSMSMLNRYGLAYTRLFGEKVAASLQFNVISHALYLSDNSYGLYSTLGWQFFPNEVLTIGCLIQNVEQAKITYPDQSQPLPVTFAFGCDWHPIRTLSMVFEIEKYQRFDLYYKFGLELQPVAPLKERGGIRAQPIELSVGMGLLWKFVELDVGISHHQQLGVSSGVSLSFSWSKKSNAKT